MWQSELINASSERLAGTIVFECLDCNVPVLNHWQCSTIIKVLSMPLTSPHLLLVSSPLVLMTTVLLFGLSFLPSYLRKCFTFFFSFSSSFSFSLSLSLLSFSLSFFLKWITLLEEREQALQPRSAGCECVGTPRA